MWKIKSFQRIARELSLSIYPWKCVNFIRIWIAQLELVRVFAVFSSLFLSNNHCINSTSISRTTFRGAFAIISVALKPLEHYSNTVLRHFRGRHNWALIMPRGVNISGNWWQNFQSEYRKSLLIWWDAFSLLFSFLFPLPKWDTWDWRSGCFLVNDVHTPPSPPSKTADGKKNLTYVSDDFKTKEKCKEFFFYMLDNFSKINFVN